MFGLPVSAGKLICGSKSIVFNDLKTTVPKVSFSVTAVSSMLDAILLFVLYHLAVKRECMIQQYCKPLRRKNIIYYIIYNSLYYLTLKYYHLRFLQKFITIYALISSYIKSIRGSFNGFIGMLYFSDTKLSVLSPE